MIANVCRPSNAVAELRKRQDGAEDFGLERWPDFGICRRAAAEDAAKVKHLDRVANRDRLRHFTRVAAQRPPHAEGAGKHIARTERHHAAGKVLDHVVGGLVGENANRQDKALGGDDLVADNDIACQRGVARGRCNPVEPNSRGDDHLSPRPGRVQLRPALRLASPAIRESHPRGRTPWILPRPETILFSIGRNGAVHHRER